jgi:hypothetical protein
MPMTGFIGRMIGVGVSLQTVVRLRSTLSFAILTVRSGSPRLESQSPKRGSVCMGSVIKKRRKKMSKHKYRKRIKANRHKKK